MLESPPNTRPQGRSARIGAAVRQATVELIAAEGAAAVTLEAVASRAGVNRTTLYRRWGDKTRLMTWALLETVSEAVPYDDHDSLQEDLIQVMTAVNQFLSTPLARSMLQIMLQNNHDPDISAAISNFWAGRLAHTEAVFERAIQRGEFTPTRDTEAVIDQLFGPIYLRHILRREPASPAYIRNLVTQVLNQRAA